MGIVEKVLGRKESDTEQEIMTDGKPKGNPGQEGEARDSGESAGGRGHGICTSETTARREAAAFG